MAAACSSIISSKGPSLNRLDNAIWSFTAFDGREIRIRTPTNSDSQASYVLAKEAASVLELNRSEGNEAALTSGIIFSETNPISPIKGFWRISTPRSISTGIVSRVAKKVVDELRQAVPAIRPAEDKSIVVVDVEKAENFAKASEITLPDVDFIQEKIGGTDVDRVPTNIAEQLTMKSFLDPFTRLASECLQKNERFFVMEAAGRGDHRFVLDNDGLLHIEKDVSTKPGYVEENRRVVLAFVDFLRQQYGQQFIELIETEYGISFARMVNDGLPLYPDHVSKCNIGVNYLEIDHIGEIYQRLRKMREYLNVMSTSSSWESVRKRPASSYLEEACTEGLSVRVARGILRAIPVRSPTVEDLRNVVASFKDVSPQESVRDLPPDQFNTIVSMIMANDEELERALTGRKISHLAIMGYHTMGEPNKGNRCRDFFELLHIFSECKKAKDFNSYSEILSHVVVKKGLLRKTPGKDNAWQCGLLIPSPNGKNGCPHWNMVEAFRDDHKGKADYILRPACRTDRNENGKLLPLTILFRSTCTNRYASNWFDTIAADLKAKGSPGSLAPENSEPYDRPYIRESSIPVWMGYLLDAKAKIASRSAYEQKLISAAEAFIEYAKEEQLRPRPELKGQKPETVISRFLNVRDFEGLSHQLTEFGAIYQEDPQYKVHQDVVFVGHSLGGALAQDNLVSFFARHKRLPLPGCEAVCFSSDGPGIDRTQDAAFMDFGRKHADLLLSQNSGFRIIHQFEYGDAVPQTGEILVGTTNYTKNDERWLNFRASIFRPLDTAKNVGIVATSPSLPHAHRIGSAIEGEDFESITLTPKDLWDLHTADTLDERLKSIFGYESLPTPKKTERMRKVFGAVASPAVAIIRTVMGNAFGDVDGRGIAAFSSNN